MKNNMLYLRLPFTLNLVMWNHMTLAPPPLLSSQSHYKQAKLSVSDRSSQVAAVIEGLEENLELLCVTGVEDQLQVP